MKRLKIIFGKLQVVVDLPADGKGGQPGNCKRPYHLIAEAEAPFGSSCKGAGEAFSASLLYLNEEAQSRFMIVEGLLTSPAPMMSAYDLGGKLAEGQRRTLSGQQKAYKSN